MTSFLGIPFSVSEVRAILASLSLEPLAGALLVYLASVLVYALRLEVVANLGAGARLGFWDALLAHLASIMVNNLTPSARAGGELARAAIASRRGKVPLAIMTSVVVFERVTEAIGVIVVIIVAVAGGLAAGPAVVLLAAVLTALVVVLVTSWDRVVGLAVRKGPRRLVEKLGLEQASGIMKRFLRDRGLVFFAVAAGTAVWLLDALRLYFISLSLGYPMSFSSSIAVSLLYLAVAVVAVTPGGLGIVEGGLVAAFAAAGLPGGAAVAATAVERLISYGLGTLLGVLAASLEGGRRAWRALR